jgi:hypothetical protein
MECKADAVGVWSSSREIDGGGGRLEMVVVALLEEQLEEKEVTVGVEPKMPSGPPSAKCSCRAFPGSIVDGDDPSCVILRSREAIIGTSRGGFWRWAACGFSAETSSLETSFTSVSSYKNWTLSGESSRRSRCRRRLFFGRGECELGNEDGPSASDMLHEERS